MRAALSPKPDQGAHRFAVLDSWRGIAACAVALLHFSTPGGHLWLLPPLRGAWFAVDFFFVLSGFVILASYGERLRQGFPIGRFMLLRLGRIYPLHLAVLGAFLAYELLAILVPGLLGRAPFSGNNEAGSFFSSAVFLQIFLETRPGWNGPSWSIAAEIWVYLIAALLFAFGRRLFWPAIALIIAGCGIRLALDTRHLAQITYLAIFRCLFGFAFGMVAFALFRRWSPSIRLSFGWATAAELALVMGGLLFISVAGPAESLTLFGPPAFAIGLFVFAFEAGWVSRALLVAPARLLGLLSYSIYLTHLFVIERLQDALQLLDWPAFAAVATRPNGLRYVVAPPLVADFLSVVLLATVVLTSWFTYATIERPARDWSRRLAKRGARPGAAALA